jgi:hypothetical protein
MDVLCTDKTRGLWTSRISRIRATRPWHSVSLLALCVKISIHSSWRAVMGRSPRSNRASETDIAFAVLVIAAFQPDGVASFRRLRREIPIHVRLSEVDTSPSIMRPNEELWVQRMRNIRIHRDVPGNFIHDGYLVHIPHVGFKITPAGLHRRMLGRRGVL